MDDLHLHFGHPSDIIGLAEFFPIELVLEKFKRIVADHLCHPISIVYVILNCIQ